MSETIRSTGGSRNASRQPRLAWRIVGFVVAVLIALGCVLAIKEQTWSRIEQLKDEFAAIESERYLLGLRAREAAVRLNGALLRFQLSGAAEERDEFRRVKRDLAERLSKTIPQLTATNERSSALEFKAAYETYLE
jgi:hypothetical protein